MARRSLRPAFLFVVMLASFSFVAGRLVYIQAVDSDRFVKMAAQQRERRVVLPPQRGSIYDREGTELAISLDAQTIFANPHFISDPAGTAAVLAPVTGLDQAALQSKLVRPTGFVYLARKVDPMVAARVAALRMPGISTVPESKRFYPAGKLASHSLGFVGVDNNGLAGLEARYDALLSGEPGEMMMERDPAGRPIPAGTWRVSPPTEGRGIALTIDREIQYAAEISIERAVSTFGAAGGSVVVLDVSSGEILAIANAPSFDPNTFSTYPDDARRNRAITDVYEPGSTSKVVTAAAAIESKVIKPTDILHVPDHIEIGGKTFTDYHSHPDEDISFADVIAESSNVGTLKVAQMVGRERLYDYLDRFGYGRATGVEFPGEATGKLPKVSGWWPTSMGTIPIGQGVAVTPLQMTAVYAAVANGGLWVAPKLIREVARADGRMTMTPPSVSRRVVDRVTALTLTQMLLGVTEKRNGTGHNAKVAGYQIAGKTGSADRISPDGRGYQGYVTSFIGFAPAGDPQLAIGVVLDNPSSHFGATTAAPVFKEVMEFSLRHLGIGPGQVLPLEGTPLPAPVRSGGAATPSGGASPLSD